MKTLEKAATDAPERLLRAGARPVAAGYQRILTPQGFPPDPDLKAPGHPLARISNRFDELRCENWM